DEFGISGWDGLGKLGQCHPVDAGCFAGMPTSEFVHAEVSISLATLAVSDVAAINTDGGAAAVLTLRRQDYVETRLKQPMAPKIGIIEAKTEHCSAKHDRIFQRGADN